MTVEKGEAKGSSNCIDMREAGIGFYFIYSLTALGTDISYLKTRVPGPVRDLCVLITVLCVWLMINEYMSDELLQVRCSICGLAQGQTNQPIFQPLKNNYSGHHQQQQHRYCDHHNHHPPHCHILTIITIATSTIILLCARR